MTIEDAIKHCRDTALSNAGNAIAYLKGGQKMLLSKHGTGGLQNDRQHLQYRIYRIRVHHMLDAGNLF